MLKNLQKQPFINSLVYNTLVYNTLVYNTLVYNTLVYNTLRIISKRKQK